MRDDVSQSATQRAHRCPRSADTYTVEIANSVAKFRSPNYSVAMISDFKHLLEKIQQLADLSSSLRRENADLRHHAVALQADNDALAQRMREAHERVQAIMQRLPPEDVPAVDPEETE
jgi:cell division protein ZapB